MTFRMIALAAALGLATTVYAAPPVAAPAAKPMNYDCTKAGNKNKAACKSVAVAPKPMAAAPAMAPKAAMAPAAMAAKPAAKPMNYDCTKAGNKNKAACKNVVVAPTAAPVAAMAPAKPMAAPMAMAPAKAAAPMAMAKPKAAAGPKAYGPNEVAATLKNGKVVHYDCSKAGNKDKKACAGK